MVGGVGGITCENLNKDTCAYAVSSSGKRCVLEKHVRRSGEEAYVCRTSEIEADKVKDWVESDQCIEACGVDRKSLGISSDSLLECGFTHKLCSSQCYNSCPNIVDLYFNLAAGEGNLQTNPKLPETNMHALFFSHVKIANICDKLQVYFFQNCVKHKGEMRGEKWRRSEVLVLWHQGQYQGSIL